MRKIIVAFIVLGLILATTLPAQAQDTVEITLHISPDIVYASTSDDIVLRSGWAACTYGLVKSFQHAASYMLMLDGTLLVSPENDNLYFTPIEPADIPTHACITAPHGENLSKTDWRYPLGQLEAGTYEIYIHVWFEHRIIDGGDYDGDGHVDFMEGTLFERTITLIVE